MAMAPSQTAGHVAAAGGARRHGTILHHHTILTLHLSGNRRRRSLKKEESRSRLSRSLSSPGGCGGGRLVEEQGGVSEESGRPKVHEYVHVNVSGRLFLIHSDNLDRFPGSLLGNVAERGEYWRDDLRALYFDRNREFFSAVHQYYQSRGSFTYPPSVTDSVVIDKELAFWRIDITESDDEEDLDSVQAFLQTANPTNKQKLYLLLNSARSSTSAHVLAWTDCSLIALSIIMIIIESEPMYKKHFSDEEEEAHKYAFAANAVIMAYFTLDFVMRVASHPSFVGFCKMCLPWLDLLSILPFYLELAMLAITDDKSAAANVHFESNHSRNDFYTVLRVCRIFRVTRVFKLVRRCESLMVLMTALSKTKKELMLLAGMVSISAVFMGSIMFYIEVDPASRHDPDYAYDEHSFSSIPSSCWWAIITITTVGYGDIVPQTFLGKVVGSFAVFLALILIALPATIIVTKFSEEYEKGNRRIQRVGRHANSLDLSHGDLCQDDSSEH